MRTTAGVLILCLLASFCWSCGRPGVTAPLTPQEVEDNGKWRAEREQSLRAESGWLTLVGLHWLNPGVNSMGSAPECAVRLDAPGIPPDLGALLLENDSVRLVPHAEGVLTVNGEPAKEQPLKSDADGQPDRLRAGRLSFYLIRRGERLGVRVKDPEAPARVNFKGLSYFPLDPRFRVTAKFIPFDAPREISIPTAIGTTETMTAPGRLEFVLDGRSLRLTPFSEGGPDEPLFIVFSDKTAGVSTYGAGRFLEAPPPKDGTVTLDFNRAYNPPCAFSHFATCPLPPPENRLPAPIEAGERKYGEH